MNGQSGVFIPNKVIAELTGRVRYSAQIRVLRGMGLTALVTPTGEPKVTWENFNLVTDSQLERVLSDEVILNGEFL
jgi:hypothetical protein